MVGITGPVLKLGFMDYGNSHFSLSGTATTTIVTIGFPKIIGLVHGNAEIVNDQLEASLTGSTMSSDNNTASNLFYHLRIDLTTLTGAYTMTEADGTVTRKGDVSVVTCSD